jgi:MoaA/NifB/PqqE/SkfB family radical SAM enzyme
MSQKEPLDTFCVHPWKHLELSTLGNVLPCCSFKGYVSKDGSPMSLLRHSMDEIWNSEEMRGIRRAMVEGRRVPGCADCYRQEAAGYQSMRMRENSAWESGWINDHMLTIDTLKSNAIASGFGLPSGPQSFQLDVGDLCNLKCRMCCSFNSSRIDRDPVHSAWANQWGPVRDRGSPWYKNSDLIQKQLLKHPEELRYLYFVGGEPMLVRQIGEILQSLIDVAVAKNVCICIQTNGTTVHAPWLKLVSEFMSTSIAISIDGYGEYYEYIRYPGKWAEIAKNVETFRQLPNVKLFAAVALQANNLLNLVDLLNYFDSAGIVVFIVNPVYEPRYLAVSAMPPRARHLAAERLLAYAERNCRPSNKDMVLGVVAGLEALGDQVNHKRLREFMLFTNDLDVTRGQSFRETDPELFELIAQTGFEWTDETLNAGRRSLPVLT